YGAHDRGRDTRAGEELATLEVVAVVEEQLRDHEVGTAVDLLLQPLPVYLLALLAGDVALRESGDANGERPDLTNALNQLIRVLEAAFGSDELAAVRRIAAQREHVRDAQRSRLLEHRASLVDRRVDAREVRHRGDLVLALNAVDDAECLVASAAAGAVCDRAEIRVQRSERRNGFFEKRPLSLIGLRGKELE